MKYSNLCALCSTPCSFRIKKPTRTYVLSCNLFQLFPVDICDVSYTMHLAQGGEHIVGLMSLDSKRNNKFKPNKNIIYQKQQINEKQQ